MTPIALAAAAFICAFPAVYDGDTWRCHDGPRVRLWGVDAVELHDPGGLEAKRALTRLISGHDLTCQHKGHSYNRVVARCFLPDGRDVGGEMVREGMAVDWPKFSHGFYGSPGVSPARTPERARPYAGDNRP